MIDKEDIKDYVKTWDGDSPGDLFLMFDLSPDLDLAQDDDMVQFLDRVCGMYFCLRVKTVLTAEQISDTEFRFMVELLDYGDDGDTFQLEDCCGKPPITEFGFIVKKGTDGNFRVVNPIIFIFLV